MNAEKSLKLHLAPWQKRMVADFMPRSAMGGLSYKQVNAVVLKPGPIRCPQSYKIPATGIRKGDWLLYLTDEQISMVAEQIGTKANITSFNISPEFVKSGEIAFVR